MTTLRKRAWNLINAHISDITGFSLDDFADSATLMCGLDDVSDLLKQGLQMEAHQVAGGIAEEILDEEGFPLFD